MKLRKYGSYKSTPWKNGGGVTSEIAIYPETANFADNDFLWRLSSAKITSTNNFSAFDGYDRILFVVKGEGLLLSENGSPHKNRLPSLIAYRFQGETPIECELLSDEVVDFGIIYKRGLFKVDTDVLELALSNEPQMLSIKDGVTLLFCAQGNCLIEDIKTNVPESMTSMDTLEIKNAANLKITIQEPTVLIKISIKEI